MLKSSDFESAKAAPWYKYQVASLAPCMVQENDCQKSVDDVDKLSGAMGSVTNKIVASMGGSPNPDELAQKVKTDPGLNATGR